MPAVPTTPIDLHDIATSADPYDVYARLRAAGSVARSPSGFWFVSGYVAANQAMRDRRMTSGPIADRYRMALPPGAARDEMAHRINFLDPPDHPRVRGLVQSTFTPKRLADLRPWIDRQADALLDEVVVGLEEGPVDLLAAFAHPLPSLVISEMLGVPDADRDQLTEWTEAVTPLLGIELEPEQKARAIDASEQFAAYARALLDERLVHPGTDLLTAMVQASAADGEVGATLLEPELLSLVVTLYSAGHRTTRDLFTNGLATLLAHPDQWEALTADPGLVPGAVREFLRFETPTLYVARVPAEPVELDGVTIGAMEPTLILLAAANRDPAVYRDPETFAITRDEAQPLSFAAGAHHCLGANLARMEAEVMLGAVARRLPGLVVDPGGSPAWHQRGPFRGLDALWVTRV